MKLKKLKICNFRSFGEEVTIQIDDLSSFIGTNSSGKSSALLALCKLFSENSSERIIAKSDFFQLDGETEKLNKELFIEAVFQPTVDNAETPLYFESYVVDKQDGVPYLRIRLEATWENDGTVEGAIDSHIYFITCSENEEITSSDKTIANRNVLNKIRVIYIPAIRNPNQQLKNASGSMMHRIMNSINWQDVTRENIKELIGNLNAATAGEKGIKLLKEAIHREWSNYQSDNRYSEADLVFNSGNIEAALTKAEIVFSSANGTKKSNVDEMGDGLRSLFYISMVESMLDIEDRIMNEEKSGADKSINLSAPILNILAVEEPENHIAPHLLGKLISRLRRISEKENSQVFVTSHSPTIVKRIDPVEIRYFRLDPEKHSTTVKEITLPDEERVAEQYKFVKEAVQAYPELYFSKLVILGEGDSEELILSKFIEINGGNIDSSEISIVPLGGRFVNHFWRLLADLEIPYITLLDLDRERFGGGWGRIKYVIQQLIEIGEKREKLLLCRGSKVLTDLELKGMHNWKIDVGNMNSWISRLEEYDVFFSSPLDIDFIMLEYYSDIYKSTLPKNEGPIINASEGNQKVEDIEDEIFPSQEYSQKVISGVRSTLKEQGGKGDTYNENQKKLMVWYNYFFLGRGKPTTHISMFSMTNDEQLKKGIPAVIQKIIDRLDVLLNGVDEDE